MPLAGEIVSGPTLIGCFSLEPDRRESQTRTCFPRVGCLGVAFTHLGTCDCRLPLPTT